MKILINLLLIIAVTIGFQAKGANPAIGFNQRDNYLDKTELGDPAQAASFIDPRGDVSHLSSLNDSSLVDRGAEELRHNPMGETLQNAEEKKIDAIERYKINSSKVMLKNSLAIEENPMAKTGGKGLSATERASSVNVEKTCTEGVDFNVDVGLELILEVEEEDYLGPLIREDRTIKFSGHTLHNEKMNWGYAVKWKDKRWGWHITPYLTKSRGDTQVESIWINNPGAIIADARKYIAGTLGVPIEQIGEQVIFPPAGRGIGNINSGFPRWRVVWDQYEFGYQFFKQENLKKLIEKDEYWQVATEGMEQLAESNECYETARVCLKSGVKTFLEKYDVERPCWYEKISYRCTSEPKDGCAHLIKQDCKLKESTCEHQIGSICLRWKRDFVCGGIKKELFYSLADSPIYCLGGDCHTPVLEENKDFANVAYLAALNEANKDCVKAGGSGLCKDPITVFPGQVDGCKKIVVGFVDCCSSMKGWGSNAHLCKCSGEERGLALKRDKGLCHMVGTYCSDRDPILKTCLTKKTNFCCFSSKLARIFHEQGRGQLGIDWGTPNSPNCRPLTLDELKSLDFSKFDMEELFDALLTKGKSNANKSFPVLSPGEIPPIQQEHMATSTEEKREIKRRAEAEEARRIEAERLAKLEAERLERERIERERLALIARQEKERLASLERERQRMEEARSRQRKAEIIKEVEKLKREEADVVYQLQAAHAYDRSLYINRQEAPPGHVCYSELNSKTVAKRVENLQKIQRLEEELRRLK